MSISSKFVLPFKVKFDSEVSGGYADELQSQYYPNTEITDYHKDAIYVDNEENVYTAILQSPFTERWVGGRQYRHVNYNTGSDSSESRPEGFHIDLQPQSIRLYSHAFRNSPPAYWTRDGRTKRPVNISNIDYDGRTEGNYKENYEFLQTSGRRINNSLVVDGFEPINQFKTLFITSSLNQDYELADLLSQTGSKSVIVERFNAPGSKEESSRGSLDRESEEYSPNIPLPFRNIKIRQPFYRQLAQHNPQFGSGSTYALLPETGTVQAVTIHKINKNRLPGTGSINDSFDNGFVTHQIPRTDIQYSWITASAVTTAAQLRGFQSYRTSTYSRRPGFDDITFMSSSLVTSGSNEQYEIDNHYLNSLSKNTKQIDIDTNTFSMSASLSASYSEIVNSNYGFPIWESLRLSDTPVVRNLRKENILSLLDVSRRVVFANGVVDQRRAETSTNYYEPAVTFKYRPLEHGLRIEGSRYNVKTDYTNTLSTFANKDLIERNRLSSEIEEDTETLYDYLRGEYKKPDGRISYVGHRYSEIIWPKEERTGLSQTRKREAYYLNKSGFDRDGYDRQLGTQRAFWRDSQEDRRRSDNSSGGYYSSFNYLSTEETGSDYNINGETSLPNFSSLEFTSSLTVESSFSNFNSISSIEKVNENNLRFRSSMKLLDTEQTNSLGELLEIMHFDKISSASSINGEFNEIFVDFQGFQGVSSSYDPNVIGSDTGSYKHLGTIYRNSEYRNIYVSNPSSFEVKTESEEIKLNPKTRYISFVGGAEIISNQSRLTNLFPFTEAEYFPNWGIRPGVVFSTMDNGLQRTTEEDSGKAPSFDSYEQYLQEIYPLTKDHSQIPEFRISEHMEDYINNPGGFGKDFSIFRIDGIDATDYKSGNSREEKNTTFIKNYLTSDLLKKSKKIEEENSDISVLDNINIKVSGIKKLLPYNGFYPQDKTLQLANLYNEYIDNNIEGGLYNISQDKTVSISELIDHESISPVSSSVTSLSSIIENDKLIVVSGMPTEAGGPNLRGSILINTSSVSGEITSSLDNAVFWDRGSKLAQSLGGAVKIISGSNGLNVFYTDYGAPSTFSYTGSLFQTTSSDGGATWSAPNTIMTGIAGSGFGVSLDALYDSNTGDYLVAVGSNRDTTFGSNGGQVYVATSNDGITWSSRLPVLTAGSFTDRFIGQSISMYSGSINNTSCIALFISLPGDMDNLGSSNGNGGIIAYASVDGGTTWSFTGLSTIAENSNHYPGLGGIKAVEYKGASYVFYSQPYEDTNGLNNNGSFYVSYTGVDGDWSSWTTVRLGDGEFSSDLYTANGLGGTIDAIVESDKISYVFGCPYAGQQSGSLYNPGKVYFGNSDQSGTQFQKGENMILELGTKGSNERYGESVSSFMYENKAHFFYMNKNYHLNLLTGSNNISLNLEIESDTAKKAAKFAAIEPVIAPGILLNTIKSGIAVDWPYATGSNAYIQDELSLIENSFIPSEKTMYSFVQENTTHSKNMIYSAHGSLKSIINARVPFESLLSPSEIFESKEQSIVTDVVENYPAGIQISNSNISNLLEKCYIYGGYEPLVDPSDTGRLMDNISQKFSVPFAYRKNGIKDNGLFTMAINNFFAETVNFFLEEGKLVTFESSPDNEWGEFKQGKTYYMDVRLEKSAELVMMEAWHSDVHPTGSNDEKMNGRYFGYPVNKTTKNVRTGEFTEEESRLIHNDPAYAPYTPPYLEGTAIARISFSPTTTGKYTLTEILDNIEIENIFVEASNGWVDGSDAQIHKMPVEASVDLRGISKVVRSEIRQSGQVTNSTVLTELPENKKWIISSRMETPVLDFSDQESVAYSSNYIKKSGYGRGMWSGYGKLPSSGSGISVEISYPFGRDFVDPYSRANDKLSLLQQIGFKAETKKVGQIRKNGKQIKEAVVLIPYLENPNAANRKSYTTSQQFFENLYFMKIDKREYNKQKRKIESGEDPTDTKESTSISRMLESMKDYVIPPYLDFLNDSSIKPFVMYLFEFEHQLSQQDLVDIWQGLMPDISYNAETEEVEISHPSAEDEFFHGKTLPENLKWMVFRVKQKAIYDFGKITSSTKDDQRFAQNTVVGREGLPYSYNWPYDYCSLVEFAKVELELNYKKKQE